MHSTRAPSAQQPIDRVVAALTERGSFPRRSGDGWTCCCPAHEDRSPSLSISVGDDGRALLHCHAGCPTEDVVAAIGLTVRDLMPFDLRGNGAAHKAREPVAKSNGKKNGKPRKAPRTFATADEAILAADRIMKAENGQRVGEYWYHDVHGALVGAVCRYDLPTAPGEKQAKKFKPVSLIDGGWQLAGMPEPRPLYRLPDLAGAKRIYVTEGEPCCEAGRSIGVVATTSAHGAKSFAQTDWAPLAGKEVVLLPDHDEAGRAYVQGVAAILAKLVPPPVVKLLELPGLPPAGDIVDWISLAFGDAAEPECIRGVLERLADAAPVWSPEAEPAAEPVAALEPVADGVIPLGQRDPQTGRLVLSSSQTLPTAEAFVREHFSHDEGRTIHDYCGELWQWRDGRYVPLDDGFAKNTLQHWLHNSLRYVTKRGTDLMELQSFPSNPNTVKAALESIKTHVHLPSETSCPSWLGAFLDRPAPNEIIACRSTLVHLPTMELLPTSPAFFSMSALEFDPDSNAPEPSAWKAFLKELFGEDEESVDLLQEWFGYVLTADTRQQKMLLIVGPKRSGKGTIARVLSRLIGPGNIVGPTTSGLAGPFGLQPLIGKSLAIVSDARFHGDNIATVLERLLCISGEDWVTIDRKFLESVTLKLPTRFMFLTNEHPRLADASGALAGRFLVLRLTESFYGREDICLTDRLLRELPGILNWSIEGWHRLHGRGHFIMPESVQDVVQDIEDLASPVGTFVREVCLLSPDRRVDVDDLYSRWQAWCARDGRSLVSNKQAFGRDLVAVAPVIRCRQGTYGRFYEGIGVK